MAAPNIETLLDIETNIETAAKSFLSIATGLDSTSAFAPLDQDDLVLPRFSVKMELGEALDPPDEKISGSNLLEYRKYAGEIVIQIVTDASTDGSQTDHRKYRGLVRGEMLRNACNFSNTNLPYYIVNYLRPNGTTFEVDGDIAISTLTYAVQLKIKEGAWPLLGGPNYRTTSGVTTTGTDTTTATTVTSTSGSTSGAFASLAITTVTSITSSVTEGSTFTESATGSFTTTRYTDTTGSTSSSSSSSGDTTTTAHDTTHTTGFTSACAN